MEKASDYRLVIVTTDSFDNAQHIARILVSEKLIACCSIIQNVISIYGWQGAVQERFEYIMFMKTSADKLDELESRITEMHNDRVPEIIAITIDSALPSYLQWIKQVVSE